MTTSFYPSNLQWVGAAKESVYGTPIAGPTFWIPVDNSVKYKPDMAVLPDTAFRGLMGGEFQQVQGMRTDTLTYKTYPYMDSIYQHFLAVLGNPDTVTGSADPYTHKTALYNGSGSNNAQPPSYTLFWTDSAGKTWQIPGCVIEDLKIDVKVDGLVTVDAQWRGLPAAAIAPVTDTPSTSKPWPAWNAQVSIGGSAVSQYSELSLDYKRDVAAVNTINNSQSPLAVGAFTMTVAGTMTAVYQGSTDVNLVDFLANTQPVLSVKMAPSGDATHSLTLQHSVTAFDAVDPQASGKWTEIQATIKALSNPTDALDSKQSPAQVIFLTPTSTAY